MAALSLLALALTGVQSVEEALSGFFKVTVMMIEARVFRADGLSRTDLTPWLSQPLLKFAGRSALELVVVLM